MKKVPCPKCGKPFHPLGLGPHKARCKKRRTAAKTGRKLVFERSSDGLFHCLWCKVTAPNSQGLASHATSRHHNEYAKHIAVRGYKPRTAAAIGISKVRGRLQKKACGLNLTMVPTDKLPLVAKMARTEMEARFKELLGSF